MECFIIENGAERKAELEDILSLIDDSGIEFIFMNALRDTDIDLAQAFVHIADEIKNKVYRNLTTRIRHRIEKEVKALEAYNKKYNVFSENARKNLISFIGENGMGCLADNSERVVWKEKVYKTPEKKPSNRNEEWTNIIENASNTGALSIDIKDLPSAAGLFEKEKIKKLSVYSDFNGTWPDFMENCRALTDLSLNVKGLTEFPSWIRNAVSLRYLTIWGSNITLLPDWIGDLQSLTELSIYNNKLNKLPENIGNLKNLVKLNIDNSDIEKLPDSIGNLISLNELRMYHNKNLASLPDCIGNLKKLTVLILVSSSMERLPDRIGDLEKLTELSLNYNIKLKRLPDSIGNLKKLKTLNISGTAIEKLPNTIVNCTSLECVDISCTNINSYPDFLSSIKSLKQTIVITPIKNVRSRFSFCNAYYTLAANLIQFAIKAKREGFLALEEELADIPDITIKEGLKLLVFGAWAENIQDIFTIKLERERNHYRKRLKLMVMEGIICIERRDSIPTVCIKLGSMVNIKNNPLDAALAKYLAGNYDAFDNINFRAALRPRYFTILERLKMPKKMKKPKNREIIRFIKRAFEILTIYKTELLPGLEKHLDNDGIMARDVFEYGLFLMVEYWNKEEVDKVLTMFADDEKDPMRKNFALAKKEAVRMVFGGETGSSFESTLLAYFDDDVTEEFLSELDEN